MPFKTPFMQLNMVATNMLDSKITWVLKLTKYKYFLIKQSTDNGDWCIIANCLWALIFSSKTRVSLILLGSKSSCLQHAVIFNHIAGIWYDLVKTSMLWNEKYKNLYLCRGCYWHEFKNTNITGISTLNTHQYPQYAASHL